MRIHLNLLLAGLFLSCGTSRISETEAISETRKQEDAIVFLSFKMEKDSVSQSNTVSLIAKTKANGKIKKSSDINADTPDYLTIEQSRDGIIIRTFTINHPLHKHIEYLGDDNRYTFKDAEVDSEEFFFRIQTTGNNDEVRIFENLKDRPKRELFTLRI